MLASLHPRVTRHMPPRPFTALALKLALALAPCFKLGLPGLHVVLCVPWYASDVTYRLNPRRAVCLCAYVYYTPNHALPAFDHPTVAVEGVSALLVASLDPQGCARVLGPRSPQEWAALQALALQALVDIHDRALQVPTPNAGNRLGQQAAMYLRCSHE